MRLSDFDYDLPSELIACYPLPERSASRLLHLDRKTGNIQHKQFIDIVDALQANDLLVFNDTRVIPARCFGKKLTGGRVEILVERILNEKRILAHVRASKSPKPGSSLQLNDNVTFLVIQRQADLFELECQDPRPVLDVIEALGEIPLPPYFNRAPDENDKERYQTIFAAHKGSVAAPTAGLHFDQKLLQRLSDKGIQQEYLTLHVGAGTFAPVRTDQITDHRMHAEYMQVTDALCEKVLNTKANGGRVIAVGTTATRGLETASRSGSIKPYAGDTDIFIYPGIPFHCIDGLITNFHLPASTLLMLVSAFAGKSSVFAAYQEAIAHHYRFFSYGDAMFIA